MAGPAKPYYLETWFEVVFLGACALALFLLFRGLMPAVEVNADMIQSVAMAKLFAEGRILDAFSRFNLPPVYPILLACIIKARHSADLPRLISAFQTLNLSLGMISAGLVHFFVRRQISKPYSFIVTALYVLAPSTLVMAWSLSPVMSYMVLSTACLLAIDIGLSRESVMGGQLSRGEIIVCGVCLGLSILSSQVGYLLLLSFLFVLIKRFGLKKSLTVIGGIILFISPFIARDVFYVVRSPQSYVAPSASIVQTISRQGIFRTVEDYADNLLTNLADHAVGDLNLNSLDQIAKTPDRSGPNQIDITRQPWIRWAIGLVALVGAFYGLYMYTGIGTLYLCTYVLTALVLLPNAGLSLAPVLPLLLFYLYFGLLRTGQWFQKLEMPLLTRLAVPVLTVWILLCTITTHLSHAKTAHNPLIPDVALHAPKVMYMSTARPPESRLEEAQTKSAHRRALDWLDAHSIDSTRVAIPRPEAASELLAKKDTSTPEGAAKQEALKTELHQYDYLVEEGGAKIAPAQSAAGNGLKLVYEDVAGRTRIWQVKSSAL